MSGKKKGAAPAQTKKVHGSNTEFALPAKTHVAVHGKKKGKK